MKHVRFPSHVKDIKLDEFTGDESQWNLCVLENASSNSLSVQEFEVYYQIIEDVVYLKPSKIYYSSEFENIFGFGMGCEYYDKNKIIKVNSPDNFAKYFE